MRWRGAVPAPPPAVGWVNYPGLDDHPQHALVQRQMRGGRPGRRAAAFGVKGGLAAGVKFIEAAQFMSHLANIGDTRTLIIHPASTTHRQLERAAAGRRRAARHGAHVGGLEHIDDILWDIDQALDELFKFELQHACDCFFMLQRFICINSLL
jgi:O-acetylhomoserine (thiol)-lyase